MKIKLIINLNYHESLKFLTFAHNVIFRQVVTIQARMIRSL